MGLALPQHRASVPRQADTASPKATETGYGETVIQVTFRSLRVSAIRLETSDCPSETRKKAHGS